MNEFVKTNEEDLLERIQAMYLVHQKTNNSRILVNNGVILISRRLLLWVFSAVTLLFLPRYLGDEGLGQLAFAQSVAGLFATVLTLGLAEFLIKEIARNRKLINSHLSAAIGLRIVMSLLVMGAIVVVAKLMGRTGDAEMILYVATGTAIAISFARLMTAVLQGLEEMSWPAVSEVTSRFLGIMIGIPVLVQGYGVVAYAVVLFAAALLNAGLNLAYVGRRFRIGISLVPSKIRFLVAGGAPFILMGFLLDVYGQTDTVVLRFFTDDAVVGWYAAANNIYKTIDLLPLALTAALLPTLSRIHHEGAREAIGIAKKSIAVGAMGIVPLAVGISIFSDQIISALPYGNDFENTVPLLTILALTIPVTAFLVILGTIAVAVDRQKAWVGALLVTVVLNLAFNIIAAPYAQEHYGNGGLGVALTTLGTELFMVGFGVWLMPRGVIDRALAMVFLKVAMAAGMMAGFVLLIRTLDVMEILLVIIGGVIYVAALAAVKAVTLSDLRFIQGTITQKIGRH